MPRSSWIIHAALFFYPLIAFCHEPQMIPRTICVLYDGKIHRSITETYVNQLAEMPLNHLGYNLEYYDIHQDLPDIENRKDVIGILTWFPYGIEPVNPNVYLHWALNLIRKGKKFIVFGNTGLDSLRKRDSEDPLKEINEFWNALGLEEEDVWVQNTFDITIESYNPLLVNFERSVTKELSPFAKIKLKSKNAQSHLRVGIGDISSDFADLIVTSPSGGYVANNYAIFQKKLGGREVKKWYINPFYFFSQALDSSIKPIPDTTTHLGRRIYYSHIDGDGWNLISQVMEFRKAKALASEVICQKAIKAFPDLPVTVAPITADVDLEWHGTPRAIEVVKDIFSLPQVEPSCHTFTHPYDWSFFNNYKEEDEFPYQDYYQKMWLKRPFFDKLFKLLKGTQTSYDSADAQHPLEVTHENQDINTKRKNRLFSYKKPREYACKPFDLRMEVKGAVDRLAEFVPQGKKINLYQWSGNCFPFEEAIKTTRENLLYNINGGDTRFDNRFFSYAWVRPLGRRVGQEYQIYSTNSNENTYEESSDRLFHTFTLLPETWKNTETPIRIKPLNLYYHMFSGGQSSYLNAVVSNLKHVQNLEICPITTSRYCAIVEGFRSTKIEKIEEYTWKILHRGNLQTIRFDHASLFSINFQRSVGVIGQRYYQGSLYAFLDEAQKIVEIALQKNSSPSEFGKSHIPYLIQSNWHISQCQIDHQNFSYIAEGFGKPYMQWRVVENGRYRISIHPSKEKNAFSSFTADSSNLLLDISLEKVQSPIKITIEKINET